MTYGFFCGGLGVVGAYLCCVPFSLHKIWDGLTYPVLIIDLADRDEYNHRFECIVMNSVSRILRMFYMYS